MMNTQNKQVQELEDALHVISEQAAANAKEQVRIAKLAMKAIAIAKGTSDVAAEARAAVAEVAEQKMPDQIRAAMLAHGPLSLVDLSKVLNQPAERVRRAAKVLRASRRLRNIGTDVSPVWWWAVGDEGETAELRESVAKLLRYRPMTLQEIVEATGARRNRISGVLVKLQVRGFPVQNLGDGQRAVWFISGSQRKRG